MVGNLMKLKRNCLGNSIGTIGVVFNDYGSGIQVIFPNGKYDGFGIDDMDNWIDQVGHSSDHELYEFKNVMQVSQDFKNGLWNSVFK